MDEGWGEKDEKDERLLLAASVVWVKTQRVCKVFSQNVCSIGF